jgi:dipeptidyl aminopeptidase/acylaminoacyl peptidase
MSIVKERFDMKNMVALFLLIISVTLSLPSYLFANQLDGTLLRREPLTEKPKPEWLSHPAITHQDVMARVNISKIYYVSNGLTISGFLIEPKASGRYPAIIFNHGGSRNFGAMGFNLKTLQLADLAADGYVVIASQYRGVADNPGQDEFGGADLDDVLNLIPLLQQLPQVDANRIGMLGESRGGMMTYMALARNHNIKAAVVLSGAADLPNAVKQRPDFGAMLRELIGGNSEEEFQQRLKHRSAVYWPERFSKTTPLLLVHGSADWRVSPQDSIQLATALLLEKVPCRLVILEGADHGLTEFPAKVRHMIGDWFARYLRVDAALPNLEPHGF